MVRSTLRRVLCAGLGGAAVVAGLSQAGAADARPQAPAAAPAVGAAPTLVDLPPLPGTERDVAYDAPWVYAVTRLSATSRVLMRTRDDGSTPWEAVVDPATQAPVTGHERVVARAGTVLVDTPSSTPGECDPFRSVDEPAVSLPGCSEPVLDGTGLAFYPARAFDRPGAVRDVATGALLASPTVGSWVDDGTWWTAQTRADVPLLVQSDVRSGRELRTAAVPSACRAASPVVTVLRSGPGGVLIRCGAGAVVVDPDGVLPPRGVPTGPEAGSGVQIVAGHTAAQRTIDGVRTVEVLDLGAGHRLDRFRYAALVAETGGEPSVVIDRNGAMQVAHLSLGDRSAPDVAAPTVRMTEAPVPLRPDFAPGGITWRWQGDDPDTADGSGLYYEIGSAYHHPRALLPDLPDHVQPQSAPVLNDTDPGISGGARGTCLFVRAVDLAGNRSPYVRACTYVDRSSPEIEWIPISYEDPARLLRVGHRLSWRVWDESAVTYRVERIEARPGRAFGVWRPATLATSRSLVRRTPQGTGTCYRITVRDALGRVSVPAVGLHGTRHYCMATPLDDRSLRVVGPHRRVRDRSAVLGTATRIARGGAVVVRERGVRVVQVETRGKDWTCPRLELNGRAVRARCTIDLPRRGGVTATYVLRSPLSGRFVVRPRGAAPIVVDSVSLLRIAP